MLVFMMDIYKFIKHEKRARFTDNYDDSHRQRRITAADTDDGSHNRTRDKREEAD